MKRVRSIARPQEIEFTDKAVFVASNITPYEEVIDGYELHGYDYDYEEYTRDEYLMKLAQDNADLRQSLIDTQMALVELYEGSEL